MTLRLSSACSNQLSYRPGKLPKAIGKIFAKQKSGGKGTRTPDIQLAKLALYQLSYAPVWDVESREFAVGSSLNPAAGPASRRGLATWSVEGMTRAQVGQALRLQDSFGKHWIARSF
jgi:hypothetical protein